MLRRDVGHHQGQQLQVFRILLQFTAPGLVVHIGQIDLHLFAHGEIIGAAVLHIKVILGRLNHINVGSAVFFKVVNGFDGAGDQVKNPGKGQVKGVYRAFQPL